MFIELKHIVNLQDQLFVSTIDEPLGSKKKCQIHGLAWHKYVQYDILTLQIYVGHVWLTYCRVNTMKT